VGRILSISLNLVHCQNTTHLAASLFDSPPPLLLPQQLQPAPVHRDTQLPSTEHRFKHPFPHQIHVYQLIPLDIASPSSLRRSPPRPKTSPICQLPQLPSTFTLPSLADFTAFLATLRSSAPLPPLFPPLVSRTSFVDDSPPFPIQAPVAISLHGQPMDPPHKVGSYMPQRSTRTNPHHFSAPASSLSQRLVRAPTVIPSVAMPPSLNVKEATPRKQKTTYSAPPLVAPWFPPRAAHLVPLA
jgi:hypothetical protein